MSEVYRPEKHLANSTSLKTEEEFTFLRLLVLFVIFLLIEACLQSRHNFTSPASLFCVQEAWHDTFLIETG